MFHPIHCIILLLSFVINIEAKKFETYDALKDQVDNYCDDPENYNTEEYGPISGWDVSDIIAMNDGIDGLFHGKETCNPNISAWDVSSVTDFTYMFFNTPSFNSDLSDWNVSAGQLFHYMFYFATSFNSDLSGWDVSAGKDFSGMFREAKSFNADISVWNFSAGVYFYAMFFDAESFYQNLTSWPPKATNATGFCTNAVCDKTATTSPTTIRSPSPSSKPTNTPTEEPTSSPSNTPTKSPTINDPCDSVEEHSSTKFARIPNRGKTGDCKWLKERSNDLRESVCGHRTKYWKDPRTGTVYPPAQEACPVTCNACGRCFENEKTRYTKYVNNKDEFIIGRCKFLESSSKKDEICNTSLTGHMYPTATEACPQSCGLPGCKK